MREIEILGKHFSEKEDIQINFLENITPQTDGKKIFLPADMPRKVAPSVLAILMHESYHIKKESKVMEKEIKKLLNGSIEDSILHQILNIIEDVRIDREVFSDYMGAKGLYEEELRRLSGKKPPENPVAWAIACAIAEAEELDSSILPAPPKKVLPLKDEIVSILKKVPVKQKRGAKKKIKYIVEDLYDVLKNYFQKPPKTSSLTSTKKKSGKGNDEGSKTGKGQTEEDTEIEKEENNKKSEEEQDNNIEEISEDKEENSEDEEQDQQEQQEQQQEEENPEDQEEQGDEEQDQQQEENQGEKQQEADKKIQEATKEVQNNTIGIHQLKRILQEEEKDDIRAVKISPAIAKRLLLAKIENTKGNLKINTKKVSSLYTAPTRIFGKTQRKIEKTTIYLVADISASMRNWMDDVKKEKREIVEEALYSIVKAATTLPSNKVDLRVLFFNDRVFSKSPRELLQKKFPSPGGGTCPMAPLQEIAEEQRGKKARVIMITDAEFFQDEVLEMEKFIQQHPHLNFAGVLITSRERKSIMEGNSLWKKFYTIKRTQDLESVFARVL